MGIFSATGAERLSLGFQPVAKRGAALLLSSAAAGAPVVPEGGGSFRAPFGRSLIADIGLAVFRQESEDVVGGLARLRRRPDDGAILFADHLQPGADIVGVAHRRNDAERGATECGGHLGDLS